MADAFIDSCVLLMEDIHSHIHSSISDGIDAFMFTFGSFFLSGLCICCEPPEQTMVVTNDGRLIIVRKLGLSLDLSRLLLTNMHTCIHACMHACMHTYMHTTFIYTHINTYMLHTLIHHSHERK